MIKPFTGEITAWHVCGCIDLKKPDGTKITLYCNKHEKPEESQPQKGILKLSFEQKPNKISEDEWI